MEYISSEQSSGDMAAPHLGHAKSPFPSILVKSNLYACVCFNLIVSFAYCFFYELKLLIDLPEIHPNLSQIQTIKQTI
jgi:hypothetical protein